MSNALKYYIESMNLEEQIYKTAFNRSEIIFKPETLYIK